MELIACVFLIIYFFLWTTLALFIGFCLYTSILFCLSALSAYLLMNAAVYMNDKSLHKAPDFFIDLLPPPQNNLYYLAPGLLLLVIVILLTIKLFIDIRKPYSKVIS